MQRLGPFAAAPRLAVAVSGGADSMALAGLAQSWCVARGGTVHAVIIDHGLRAASATEAALTRARLAVRGIPAEIITLCGLAGPGVQARARAARYAALTAAARANGCLHLLLGHHAGDQAETVAMRAARGARGQAGMPGWAARNDVVLLRPLLGADPAWPRAYLRAEGVGWLEDPSNADRQFERARVRAAAATRPPVPQDPRHADARHADPRHAGPRHADARQADARRSEELEAAEFLARHACFRPEGFVLLAAAAAPPAALAALLRMIGGADYPPARAAVAALAARPRAATLGGVRILPAGRLGPGWLLAREPAACAPPVAAAAGAVWDRRFRLRDSRGGAVLGALGAEAARFRGAGGLPSAVLQSMPCLRPARGETAFPLPASLALFCPPAPAACHPFYT